MESDRNRILTESIKRLLRRKADSHLYKIVNKAHAADLSHVFYYLSTRDQLKLFGMIADIEQKGALFSELDENIFLDLVKGIDLEDMVNILESMPNDDVTDLISRLPEETADAILGKMRKEDSEEVEGLLRYEDDTAGGIMVPDFVALKEDTTAREAIESFQKENLDVEMPFYLYVVDEYGKLVGVSSLRQLVVVPPDTPLKDFMTTDIFAVKTDMDQEEVAKIVAHYDILAVPVVDEANKLVGIVTVDDVIDIIRQEATEDILKMAGAGEEYVETKSVFKSIKIRMPWLFACCIGGIISSFIISYFQESLSKMAYIAAFIPVIMGMSGNVGIQSSTIVVRGLATGRLNIRDLRAVVLKELSIGFLLGIFYGFSIALVAQIRYGRAALALSVALAVVCAMSLASLSGSLMPMVFARLNMDPAVSTGPFVTTAIDMASVFLYFNIAVTFLGI